jgi:arylsulfatase A-like enzyme
LPSLRSRELAREECLVERLLILVLLVALSIYALPPAAPQASRPDVVVLLTDQQRAGAMGVAGEPGAVTPAMDRLAREGVRFTHAFCPTPQCSPSRAALLTGRYPHRAGVMSNVPETGREGPGAAMSPPLDPRVPGLGKVFAAAGYETAYIGKWHLGGDPRQHGFQTYAPLDTDPRVTEDALAFLKKRAAASGPPRPLLLVVSWLNPHNIYRVGNAEGIPPEALARVRLPESLADDLSTKPLPQRVYLTDDQGKPWARARADDWRRYLAFYYQVLNRVDAEIGQVTEVLRRDSPNALLVFSSDHGDLGGAHRLPFKGPAMYEELVRVPLVISWPGKIRPAVNDALVNNIDLLPTLCDLAGLPPPGGTDGRSLRPLLGLAAPTDAAAATPEVVYGEYYGKQSWRVPIRMVRTREWKYVRYTRYGEELYQLSADPWELKNLAGAPEHAAVQHDLANRLDRWIAQTADPFPTLTPTDREGNPITEGGARASGRWPLLRLFRFPRR